jgi:hypothetical protein
MQSRSPRRGVTVSLVGVLAVVGCADRGDDATRGPTATVRNEPATTTTTGVPVDQVPGVIDVAYIQRVIDALDRVMGDAVRALVAAKAPDREFYERLRAVYLDPEFERVQASFGRSAADGLAGFSDAPGNPITRVGRVLTTANDCIFAEVDRDLGPTLDHAPSQEQRRTFLGLGTKKAEYDPTARNPTAWMIGYDGRNVHGSEPPNPCA